MQVVTNQADPAQKWECAECAWKGTVADSKEAITDLDSGVSIMVCPTPDCKNTDFYRLGVGSE